LATFEEQVEGMTGLTIGSSPAPDSNVFTDMLREGVRDVVNKMTEVRPETLNLFTDTTNSTSNIDKVGKVLSVVREHDSTSILRKCTAIDPGDRYEATDADSLLYRSKTNPGWYEIDGQIHCVPAAGSGNNDIVVTQVYYDAGLVGGDTYGGGNILSFPVDYEHLVVLYAAIRCFQAALAAKSAPSVPVSQAIPILNITATDPTAITLTTVNYNPVIASSSTVLTSLTAPTYTKPTLVLGATPTISDLSITVASPVTPSLSSVTFTSIDSALDANVPVFITATISAASTYTGSAPTYIKPTVSLGTAPTISNLSITAVPPDVPAQATTLPTYEAASASVSDGSIEAEISKLQDYIEDEEDIGLATAKVAEINMRFQRASEEFNNEIKKWQTENSGELQRYQAEVSEYQAEINAEVQEYQQNLAGDIQVWQAERQTDLQKYGTDIQNELNEFNNENVAYQSAIQESTQELQVANQVNLAKAQADLQVATANEDRDQQRQLQNGINDMQAIINDNNRKVSLYQTDISSYNAQVTKEVQEYQQNLAGDLQVWQTERQTDLQKYGSDIQSELNEFTKENASFQYEAQKALADAQATNQVALQNGVQEAKDAIENNSAQIARFQSMAQHYSTQVNEDVQKYTAQIQALSADIAASVAEHTAELQGTQAEYLWLQDQYTKLKTEYDQAFAITAPQE